MAAKLVARLASWVFVAVVGLLLPTNLFGQTLTGWPTESPPASLEPAEVQFPHYDVRTLDNGMRVVAVLHHEQPIVSVRLFVGAGMAREPADKAGLASLLAALLDQGTTSRTAQEIAETIDTIGGGLGVGASRDLALGFASMAADEHLFGRGIGLGEAFDDSDPALKRRLVVRMAVTCAYKRKGQYADEYSDQITSSHSFLRCLE